MFKKILNSKIITCLSLLLVIAIISSVPNNIFVKALEPADLFSDFSSKSTLLIHADSDTILYAKNENHKMQVASISKLMTTLLTLEKLNSSALSLEDELTASSHAASMEGSQAFLDEGSNYKVRELLKSVIVASANDSAVVLAESIGGSESAFVNLMNERAVQLKMTNTKYANSTGLPAPDQYSTAIDTAKILKEVSKYDLFNKDSQIWMDKFVHPSGRETELVNTNRLIKYYSNTVNGKTGFTDEAGYCLATSASYKGLNLIAVTLNCSNSTNRFKENMELFNYGFANFENKQVLNKEEKIEKTVKVHSGKTATATLKPETSYFVINKKGINSDIILSYEIKEKVNAPLKEGDIVGKCLVVVNGKVIGEVNIISCETVEKQTFSDSFTNILKKWALN